MKGTFMDQSDLAIAFDGVLEQFIYELRGVVRAQGEMEVCYPLECACMALEGVGFLWEQLSRSVKQRFFSRLRDAIVIYQSLWLQAVCPKVLVISFPQGVV